MKNKINLLYMIQSLNNGGAETLAIRLAQNLDPTRFTPVVCSLCDEGPLRGILESTHIPHITLGKKEGKDMGLPFRIRKVLASHRIDLVHTHNQGPLLYTRLATLGGYRSVKLIHTEHINMAKEYSYAGRHRFLNRFLFKGIHGFVSIAAHLNQGFEQQIKSSGAMFTTINNSVSVPEPERVSPGILHRELGIDPTWSIVGNVSALRRQKDHTTLIKAMRLVVDQRPDTILAIAGDGELKTALHELTRDLGLTNHVRFLGYRSDVDHLLAQFDIFVLSSLYEGLPLCILEAMAAARPVVATDAEGTNAVVHHGKTGLLVPLKDPENLAAALLGMLQNKTAARKMGAAARKLIRDEYNMETMIQQYETFYQQVLLRH
ncbi:MAG: glycosyltransferase [Desulfotignum sp.]|nr:glycosyltransferase [Desulfotignum sp.]MCF8135803.1 glycosyltransferase [Desulfotignum sp.]